MTCTEDYGAICPNCRYKRVMVRYGSDGILHYDACPNCGFAYAYNGYDSPLIGEDFWKAEIEIMKSILKRGHYSVSREGIKNFIDGLPEPVEIPLVFDWNNPALRMVLKTLMEEKIILS